MPVMVLSVFCQPYARIGFVVHVCSQGGAEGGAVASPKMPKSTFLTENCAKLKFLYFFSAENLAREA